MILVDLRGLNGDVESTIVGLKQHKWEFDKQKVLKKGLTKH